ncbi:MAG: NFACT family protein [Bacilli bacterium]|nr:NFACT family protein [Bacilli bacterium]
MDTQTLAKVIKKLNETVVSNFIAKTTVLNKTDCLLSFSFYKNEQLLISLNHNNPFIGLVKKREDIVTENGNLNEQLKQRVRNTYIEEINQLNDDRILQIKLSFSDDFNAKRHYFLIIELIPHHPNLLILDDQNTIIFANHYTDITVDRVLIRNGRYQLPEKHESNPQNISLESFNESCERYLDKVLTNKQLNPYSNLLKYLDKEIKKCHRKEEVLLKEISDSSNYADFKERGDSILTYAYDKEELSNYLKENSIEYDNNLSPIDNANKQFKLYRKKKATITHDEEEIKKNKERLNQLLDDLDTIKSLDLYKINALQSRYPKFIKKQKIVINPKYPFFTIINGVKYAFGRNAMQNDYLTFRLADKDHYFFHIKDYAGAHVILMKDNPTEQEISVASQIAIYVSKRDIGEVSYAKVSTIKKGQKAGEVILSSYSSYVVKNIEEEVKLAVKNASRFI